MRYASLATASLLVATTCLGADEPPTATRVLDGTKTTFPAKAVPDGTKALAGVLGSCHTLSDGTVRYTADDLKKARTGDHVRFEFAKPLAVKILGTALDVSEAVYADGVFWLVCGTDVVRCTKYEFDKMDRFREWYRQTLP
jgi:hypothetical protein